MSATSVRDDVLAHRRLVRTWGQRDTIHLYHPDHWRLIVAARKEWSVSGRRRAMPTDALVENARLFVQQANRTVTRTDVIPLLTKSYLALVERELNGQLEPKRFGAGRLLWSLALRGDICVAEKKGAEQAYAARSLWFPKLKWPRINSLKACIELTRHYLAAYGPATEHDVAHFYGATVTSARKWLASLDKAGELLDVQAGARSLVALAADEAELREAAPKGTKAWPLRLLPMWDGFLMGHADKHWTTPREDERPLIWRKAAVVAPTILSRGRAVATWKHRVKRRRLEVEVQPLRDWRTTLLAGVRREATALAAHLGVGDVDVSIDG